MADHYFTAKPSGPKRTDIIEVECRGVKAHFVVSSGVFSTSRVDQGSELLIESAIIQPNSHVLDLGCGYGPIGVILARCFPKATFLLADVNERAVELAEENIERNGIRNARVRISNGFEKIEESFDVILLNPPQTAGRQVCVGLIQDSFIHLNKGGSFQMVARHKKGGQTLAKVMEATFGNVKTIARESGYHVYLSEKEQ